jgi:hypothetical protein
VGKTIEPSLDIVAEKDMSWFKSKFATSKFRVLPVVDVELRYADAVRVGMIGSPSKMTVTVKLAVPVLPSASVAVQVTIEIPTGNRLPDAGEQLGPLVTPTLSVAIPFENVTTAPCEFVVSKVMLSGGVTIGGVVSGSSGIVTEVVPLVELLS